MKYLSGGHIPAAAELMVCVRTRPSKRSCDLVTTRLSGDAPTAGAAQEWKSCSGWRCSSAPLVRCTRQCWQSSYVQPNTSYSRGSGVFNET